VKTNSGLIVTVKKKSLCLINQAQCHQDLLGSGGIAPPFLNSALDRGEWLPLLPGSFKSEKEPLVPTG
jgi:hypothetical protein